MTLIALRVNVQVTAVRGSLDPIYERPRPAKEGAQSSCEPL
jgi:hypothetical protein